MITVAIPVGPNPSNRQYLRECLESVYAQTRKPDEILLIDDQAHLMPEDIGYKARLMDYEAFSDNRTEKFTPVLGGFYPSWQEISVYRTPWIVGVAHAFNFCVAVAKNPLVLMLGSDDLLEPWCLEDIAREWEVQRQPLGYYYLDVKYMDTGEEQGLPCNAAVVHKELWKHTGGFPVESAVGAPDTIFVSMMLHFKHEAGYLIRVKSKSPPYLYRRHAQTDSNTRGVRYGGAAAQVRGVFTTEWRPPTWTR